ncbi:Jerky protein-like protein-like [Ceratocystis lukuohia]|uniref:Jerky protein-like protein-like n=1 Tax=Ceratocystis lukuohia TaxID=2019550 RepID=A0ABR4MLG9_9PEZI
MTEVVIKEAFREAGLAPWDPEAVISKLDTQPQTSTSVEEEAGLPNPLVSETPGAVLGAISQLEHLEREIRRDQNNSPASILAALKSLANETNAVIHEIALMRYEFEDLRQASDTLSEQHRGKRDPSQNRENMTVGEEIEGTDQVDIDMQIQAESSRH